jgi:hypothetical protein
MKFWLPFFAFTLLLFVELSFTQQCSLFPNSCITYTEASYFVELIFVNLECCDLFQPQPEKNKPANSITFSWITFNFANTRTLSIYSGNSNDASNLVATLTGNTVPNPITINGPTALFLITGSGNATFQMNYSSTQSISTKDSLLVFYSLLFVFLIPLGCTGFFSCPFICANSPSKKRYTNIIFLVSSGFGFLFFALTLAGDLIK